MNLITPQATGQVDGLDERTIRILKFCKTPKSREEIQKFIGIKDREYFQKKTHLNHLLTTIYCSQQFLINPAARNKNIIVSLIYFAKPYNCIQYY